MFVISNSFLVCFFSSISHFFSFYVAVSIWHAVPNSTHFWCLIKSIENNKSFMEDQIFGKNIDSNLFIFLPKSNFHKSFLPMGFQQLIPKLQFVLIKQTCFFFNLKVFDWEYNLTKTFMPSVYLNKRANLQLFEKNCKQTKKS